MPYLPKENHVDLENSHAEEPVELSSEDIKNLSPADLYRIGRVAEGHGLNGFNLEHQREIKNAKEIIEERKNLDTDK